MFWNNFVNLCIENNTKPNPVAKELGLSSGSVTNWKKGQIPQNTTLKKIADYFGVSTESLLSDQKGNSMFWNSFVTQCNRSGKTPNGVCADLGLSSAIATRWKNGSVPRDTTLKRIADYFGITVEDLLCDPNESVDSTKQDLYNLFEGLSPEKQEQLKLYAKFLRDQK